MLMRGLHGEIPWANSFLWEPLLRCAQVLSFFMSQKAGSGRVLLARPEPGPRQASPIASEGVSLLVPAYVIGARRTAGIWLSCMWKVGRTASISSNMGSAVLPNKLQGGVAIHLNPLASHHFWICDALLSIALQTKATDGQSILVVGLHP